MLAQGVAVGQKVGSPAAQGFGVVGADVFQVHGFQVTSGHHGVLDCRNGWQEAAGENITLDEVDAVFGFFVAPVVDGDGLNHGNAIGLQQLADGLEVGVQVLVANGFDHFHRYQLVEGALQLAVVFFQQGDAIL